MNRRDIIRLDLHYAIRFKCINIQIAIHLNLAGHYISRETAGEVFAACHVAKAIGLRITTRIMKRYFASAKIWIYTGVKLPTIAHASGIFFQQLVHLIAIENKFCAINQLISWTPMRINGHCAISIGGIVPKHFFPRRNDCIAIRRSSPTIQYIALFAKTTFTTSRHCIKIWTPLSTTKKNVSAEIAFSSIPVKNDGIPV